MGPIPLVARLRSCWRVTVERGYHRHYLGGSGALLPAYDVEGGLVLAPMRQGIRLTTGAEFALVGEAQP